MVHATRFDVCNMVRLSAVFLAALSGSGFSVIGTARPAAAQSGLEVLKEDWNAAKETVESSRAFSDPDLFGSAVAAGWRAAQPDLNKAVEQQMGEVNKKLPDGVSLYEVHSTLGAEPKVTARQDGNAVRVSISVPRNLLIAKSTTPTVLGSYADPKISVDYDLTLDVVIAIPSQTQPLRVTEMKAVVSNVNLDSQNFSADVLKAVGSVIDFFGGPDFRSILEKKIADRSTKGMQVFIDQNLGPVNTVLTDLSKQGFTVLNVLNSLQAQNTRKPIQMASARKNMAFAPSRDTLTLLVYRAKYEVPIIGPGVVTGTIRWAKALGRPNGTDSPFVFTARVATGPVTAAEGPRFDFTRKGFTPPVEATIEETADGYVCHYTLHSLPYDVPMLLSVAKRSDVDWVALNPQPLPPVSAAFIPQGWSGKVLVHPAPKSLISPTAQVSAVTTKRYSAIGATAAEPQPSSPARPVGSLRGAQATRNSGVVSAIRPTTSVTEAARSYTTLLSRTDPDGAGHVDHIDFTLAMTAAPVIR